ncbi:MAG: inorganic phosphate transporter [Planctomycetota bacterium]|jgi:PiT family inorganic phosphate transporter
MRAVLLAIGILAVLALAFANGANDNAKPVATLVGAGLTGPRRALLYGTLATLAGSVLAIALGKALVASFSAKGLVGAEVAQSAPFLLSVTVGAAGTVLAATRLGLPISTTHALIGAILGAGAVLGAVNFPLLGGAFMLPLLTSPLAAFAATATIYPVLHRARVALGIGRESCLCIGTEVVPVGSAAAARLTARVGQAGECRERYAGTVLGVRAQGVATALHWTSALGVSFARGLQDGAKITGIALLLGFGGAPISVAILVAVAMAAGGLMAARRVEETMAHRITRMNDGQALLSNVLSAGIIFGATALGAPVSTTHVTSGGLFGVRAHTDRPQNSWLGRILLSWVGTLPLAAAIAAVIALATAIRA